MTKIHFAILNKKRLKEFSNMHLSSAFPVRESDDHIEWLCECKNGDLLRVIYMMGLVSMTRAETENELMAHRINATKAIIGISEKEDIGKLTFEDIKLYMNWRIHEDNYIL